VLTLSYLPFLCISEINTTETDMYLNNCKFSIFIKIELLECEKGNTFFVLILEEQNKV
jgi:hypothetical protein